VIARTGTARKMLLPTARNEAATLPPTQCPAKLVTAFRAEGTIMLAHVTRRRLMLLVFVAIVILLLLPLLVTAAPNAAPPVGTWSGRTDDGRSVSLIMTEDGGFYLKVNNSETLRGSWTWSPVTTETGIVHCQPADWPKHRPSNYYIVWLDVNRIELSNYYVDAVLERMF
jgi:hypothetical protein